MYWSTFFKFYLIFETFNSQWHFFHIRFIASRSLKKFIRFNLHEFNRKYSNIYWCSKTIFLEELFGPMRVALSLSTLLCLISLTIIILWNSVLLIVYLKSSQYRFFQVFSLLYLHCEKINKSYKYFNNFS